MESSSSSIALEIMNMISPHNYVDQVSHITQRDVFPQHTYPLMPLSEIYWLDTRKCYRQKRKNLTQLFKVFGALNNEDPETIRSDMISRIKHECNYYKHVDRDHLKRIGLNINQWLNLMESSSVFADELMLFALARTFKVHVVVFTRNRCWSMIGSDDYISGDRLLEICDVKLLYVGQHMFAELRPKPFILVTKLVMSKLPNYSHLKSTTDDEIPTPIDLSKPTADNGDQANPTYPLPCGNLNNNLDRKSSTTSVMEPADINTDNNDDTDSASYHSSDENINSEWTVLNKK